MEYDHGPAAVATELLADGERMRPRSRAEAPGHPAAAVEGSPTPRAPKALVPNPAGRPLPGAMTTARPPSSPRSHPRERQQATACPPRPARLDPRGGPLPASGPIRRTVARSADVPGRQATRVSGGHSQAPSITSG
ncbi:hypothetical protein Shyhy01_33400 [Streptomyces hygroscopicus subsp. hygroscopicus]|nr:hypothetical protein Shyhy01_33400 [Streptomyces hygroscopicus subsp. hygroscopicus]